MADTKISQLPAATTPLSGAEVVPMVQSGATVQTPANEISKLVTQLANTFTQDQTFSAATIVGAGTDQVKASVSGTTSSVQWGAPSVGGHFKIAYDRSVGAATITTGFLASPITTIVTDASGNVGIGASAGGFKFVVSDGTTTMIMNPGGAIGYAGLSTNHPYVLLTNNSERMRIDASGNVIVTGSGGLGYGTGSGGTVTQLTNKSTGVTINKTNGQIITASGTIAAGTPTSFLVTNSTVAATDVVIVHRSSGGSNVSYTIGCDLVSAGSFRVYIDNISAAGLNEVLTLNFAVIKAVTS